LARVSPIQRTRTPRLLLDWNDGEGESGPRKRPVRQQAFAELFGHYRFWRNGEGGGQVEGVAFLAPLSSISSPSLQWRE